MRKRCLVFNRITGRSGMTCRRPRPAKASLQIEGLSNSPLRVEVLRIFATTMFFVLGIVAGRLWGMWRRYRQLKIADLPAQRVPWQRFEANLKQLGISAREPVKVG
jgi:hypothetical protein